MCRCKGCTSEKLIKNLKAESNGPDDIDGFEELDYAAQQKVSKAWDEGHGLSGRWTSSLIAELR